MKRNYLRSYVPPIPVLQVRFGTPEFGLTTEPLEAIVDTGADGTLVPLKYLQDIEASVGGQSGLSSQWGERRMINLYLVDVKIEALTLPGIWVVGDDLSDEVILGRNVLNRLKVLLDGPSAVTELSDS